jgi:hypothetical protein
MEDTETAERRGRTRGEKRDLTSKGVLKGPSCVEQKRGKEREFGGAAVGGRSISRFAHCGGLASQHEPRRRFVVRLNARNPAYLRNKTHLVPARKTLPYPSRRRPRRGIVRQVPPSDLPRADDKVGHSRGVDLLLGPNNWIAWASPARMASRASPVRQCATPSGLCVAAGLAASCQWSARDRAFSRLNSHCVRPEPGCLMGPQGSWGERHPGRQGKSVGRPGASRNVERVT